MTIRTIAMDAFDFLIKETQKKVYIYEKSNAFKKILLYCAGKRPRNFEYELCLSRPMSPGFYKIFPHNKIKRRWRPGIPESLSEKKK